MTMYYIFRCLAMRRADRQTEETYRHKLMTSGVCAVAMILSLGILVPPVQAAEFCGSLERRQGPWDYTDPGAQSQLELVERFHFSSAVVMLQGTPSALAGNLSYTLGRFPTTTGPWMQCPGWLSGKGGINRTTRSIRSIVTLIGPCGGARMIPP
jgi:hypothetical protein